MNDGLGLSASVQDRILLVARTAADLAARVQIEAVGYRALDCMLWVR